METKEWRYKNKRQVYRTSGSGPLVVLLHGFGEDGNIWQQQVDAFPNHQLLIPDLPGSGGSEMVDDMSMEGLAEVIYELTARPPQSPKGDLSNAQPTASPNPSKEGPSNTQPLPVGETVIEVESSKSGAGAVASSPLGELEGAGEAVLIGHSMGGYIALAFAEKYPGALNGLGLFHSTAFADSEEKKEARRKGIAFINDNGAHAFLKTTIPNLYSPQTKAERPQLIDAQVAAAGTFSAAALIAYYEAMMARPDRTNVLRKARVPVLFVLGKHDTAIPVEDGWKLGHLPDTAYIHLLQNSGHTGMIEEAEAANKILEEFVTTVENPALT